MLKAFYPSQFGRKDIDDSRKVYGCNVKEDNLAPPHPPNMIPLHIATMIVLVMSAFFLLTWNLKLLMIVIYHNGRSRIYQQLSTLHGKQNEQ